MNFMRPLFLYLVAASSLYAAQQKQIDVSATQVWTDTGLDLKAGDSVAITAIGTIQFDADHNSGPDGMARGWKDLMMQYPIANSGRGALIGRMTDNPAARAFLVGAQLQKTVPVDGRFFLGVNEQASALGSGSYHVTIAITKGTGVAAAASLHITPLSQEMLDQIPHA